MTLKHIFSLLLALALLGSGFSAFSATLHEMVKSGDVQGVGKMVAANRDMVNAKNDLGSSPLHIAAGISVPEMVRLLLDKGANVSMKDNNGVTPLHIAAFTGHRENLELLLAKGADVHAKDSHGKTARDYAETTLNREISAILLIKMLATPASAARK